MKNSFVCITHVSFPYSNVVVKYEQSHGEYTHSSSSFRDAQHWHVFRLNSHDETLALLIIVPKGQLQSLQPINIHGKPIMRLISSKTPKVIIAHI